jgi:hypothetical protein
LIIAPHFRGGLAGGFSAGFEMGAGPMRLSTRGFVTGSMTVGRFAK